MDSRVFSLASGTFLPKSLDSVIRFQSGTLSSDSSQSKVRKEQGYCVGEQDYCVKGRISAEGNLQFV